LWSRQLGGFAGPWGTAASPLIIGDLVVQNCDAEDQAFLLAVDKRTGKDVWRTPRERLRGWSTPLLVDAGGRSELVLNGETGVRGYDLQSGKELWFCKGDTGRGTPTVTPAGDLLVVVNGRPGAMFAVRPGGQGQVNATHEVWRTMRRGGRDLPSPIVVGEHLLVVNLRPGVATCYLAASGEELGKQRLNGAFSASPIAAGGVAYFPNEDGEVFVLQPADDGVKIVARNRIQPMFDNEVFRSSVTPLADGSLLLRSSRAIYCIGP
jgi:outer membrane protein assembly factor BamB